MNAVRGKRIFQRAMRVRKREEVNRMNEQMNGRIIE